MIRGRLTTLACLLVCLPAAAAVAQVAPRELLIYYGWPSAINGTYEVNAAAAQFAPYGYVVLGDGLEKSDHPDHANTAAIVAAVRALGPTRFFGYVDLGVATQNLPLTEVALRVDEWLATGADGIFFDDFGYDFQVSRARQNAAVEHAHLLGSPVIANGWNADDVFGSQIDAAYNPQGLPTSLGAADFYLAESFQISEGGYQGETAWYAKVVAVAAYREALGFRILSATTNDAANAYDQDRFFYAWYSALLCGHEATGWGEYGFAAISCSAPHRERPVVAAGSAFTSAIIAESPIYRRRTDAGQVTIDTASHASGFTPGAVGVGDDPPAAAIVVCSPNPFNPTTTIQLDVPRPARTTVEVFALDGRRVATLARDAALAAGPHRLRFDGRGLPSGTYVCRVTAGARRETVTLTLVR